MFVDSETKAKYFNKGKLFIVAVAVGRTAPPGAARQGRQARQIPRRHVSRVGGSRRPLLAK